jgi:prephenate dehydrogenase
LDVGLVGAGKMGELFLQFFRDKDHKIIIYDSESSRARTIANKYDCIWSESLQKSVSNANLVLVCTPIDITPNIIRSILPKMKDGSILCEIASLKLNTVIAMKDAKKFGVQPLSIHPMFGPNINRFKGKTMIVVPVLNPNVELSSAKEIFPDMRLVVVEAETHDNAMASVLSLTYFMNLVFARTLSSEEIELLREVAGSTFTIQLAVSQSIIDESPELIGSLIKGNVFSEKKINRFIDDVNIVRNILKNDSCEIGHFLVELRNSMIKDPKYYLAKKVRNEIFESIENI